jgi:hypothetical protein
MKLIDILKEIKIQKPGFIPKEKWLEEFTNCKSENIYEITYKDYDSEEIITNKITDIGLDGNDNDDWWLNCSILGKENHDENEWNAEYYPQIDNNDIKKVIKIK